MSDEQEIPMGGTGAGGLGEDDGQTDMPVDIRIQMRNGKKSITTVAGLADDLDLKRILKAFRRNFQCNGSVVVDENHGEIIQLQGDQRKGVRDFLLDQSIVSKEAIIVHGF